MNKKNCLLLLVYLFSSVSMAGDISTTDDRGKIISLETPAKRIISLSPHTTEMLFSAGAGQFIIGRDKFSNYPRSAESIPIVGDIVNLDYESILVANPDLIVMWATGGNSRIINKLESYGFVVFASDPKTVEDIPNTIHKLSRLTANPAVSSSTNQKMEEFRNGFSLLKKRYGDKNKVRVFYQVWNRPLYTLNGNHLTSQIISMCGGINVFSDLFQLAPTVSVEAVLKVNPDVIISGQEHPHEQILTQWQKYTFMSAVHRENIYSVDADLLQRPTLRLLEGATELCDYVEMARKKLN